MQQGYRWIDPALAPRPVRCPRCGGTGVVDSAYKLSPSEIEVLSAAARGLDHREIGYQSGRSLQTVKNHLSSAYRKLGVGSLSEAVYMVWLREHLGDGPGAAHVQKVP